MPKVVTTAAASGAAPLIELEKDTLLAAGAVALEGLNAILKTQGVLLDPLALCIADKMTYITVEDLVMAMKIAVQKEDGVSHALH